MDKKVKNNYKDQDEKENRITNHELQELADGMNPKYINNKWEDFETIIILLAKELVAYRETYSK